jgi:hypothetical protein
MLEKTVTVEWFPSTNLLIEAYQQTEFRFSFAGPPDKNGIFKQCHVWTKCRDFLPDAVRATIINKTFSIYGFNFNPNNNPVLDLDTMRMLVYKSDLKSANETEFEDKMFFGINLLNHYERIMKINPSVLYRTKENYNNKPVYLFVGNGEWMRSPFLISLYTLLIRLGDKKIVFKDNQELMDRYKVLIAKHTSGKIYDNDIGYLNSMWDVLHVMIENRETLTYGHKSMDPLFKDPLVNDSSFHNRTGIRSLSQAATPIQERNEAIKKLKKETA